MRKGLIIGILICFAVALFSWYLGKLIPIIGGPVFGITFGILLALIKRPESFNIGIKYTSRKLLQYSIILLGFEMNLYNIIKVGGQSLLVMLFTLSAAFVTAYGVGKLLKIDGNTTILIGVGTAICGGSAIAATAPVIRAEEKEVAHAISTIFLFNVLAVFLFPPLGHLMGLSDTGFGMWAGTAINDTSSVVAAGLSWSAAAGNNDALAFATIVKLTRTLMIVPITVLLAILIAKKQAGMQAGMQEGMQAGGNENKFSILRIFPWFVMGFVGTALINTFLPLPAGMSEMLAGLGKFMIVMAMAAIGLNTNLVELAKNGKAPILLGICCWVAVATVSLAVQYFMGDLY